MTEYAVTRRWHRRTLAAFDWLGARCRRPRHRVEAAEPRSILLIRLERFGDVLTLLPAIARARELFPRARFTWMVRHEYRDFIRAVGVVDEIWSVASWKSALPPGPRRFDLAFDFHADPRYLLLGRIHARRLAGYGIRGGGFWLDVAATYPWSLEAATRHLRLVEAAAGAPRRRLFSSTTLRSRIAAPPPSAHGKQIEPDSGYVIVHPGCGQPSKRWPRDRWRELLAHCRDQGTAVVLTGGEQDRALCHWLAADTDANGAMPRDLSGKTTWIGLANLVAHAACVVAPDTGIIHLAHALGTPTVALFGPNDPIVWGYPNTLRHRSLVRRLPCSFCAHGQCPRVPWPASSPCLTAISAADVALALDSILALQTRPPTGIVARCSPTGAPSSLSF